MTQALRDSDSALSLVAPEVSEATVIEVIVLKRKLTLLQRYLSEQQSLHRVHCESLD